MKHYKIREGGFLEFLIGTACISCFVAMAIIGVYYYPI